jgi:hypothetical protein
MMEELIKKKKISENENYELWVAKVPGVDVDCYAIINRDFGVVELSTSILANAHRLLDRLNNWILHPGNADTDSLPDITELQ